MALNEIRTWLIAYDISCPKRLGRVHRYLKSVAIPVQYSMFTAEENEAGIRRIIGELKTRIHPTADDLRLYPLPNRLELHHYGHRALPVGLLLLANVAQRNSAIVAGLTACVEAASTEQESSSNP